MVLELFCNICHEAFVATHDVRSTPCGHVSHRHCITNWLARSSTCPECRQICPISSLIKIFIKSRTAFTDDIQGTNLKLTSQLEQDVKKLSETQRSLDESEKKLAELANKMDNVTKELAVLSQHENGEYEGNPRASQTDIRFRRQSDGGICNKPWFDLEIMDVYQYAKKLRRIGYKETLYNGAPIYVRRQSFPSKSRIGRDKRDLNTGRIGL